RKTFFLVRDRNRDQTAREAGEIPQESLAVFGGQHAYDQDERPRHAFLEITKGGRHSATAVRIVAAVEPDFASGWRKRGECTLRQKLQTRGPFRARYAGLEGGGGNVQARCAQRRNRNAGVVELMAALQLWQPQIEKAIVVLIDQPAMFLVDVPMLV